MKISAKTTIGIDIGGQTFDLTLTEAEDLFQALKIALGKKEGTDYDKYKKIFEDYDKKRDIPYRPPYTIPMSPSYPDYPWKMPPPFYC